MNNTNTRVTIVKSNKSLLESTPVNNGAVYFIQDTKELFFDFESIRTEIKDILTLATDDERTSILFVPLNKFYFVLDTQVLWFYKDGTWYQVTSDLSNYYTKNEINDLLILKQDVIADLDTIRSGAALGSTALQEETDPIYISDKPTLALKSEIPTNTSQLNNDSGFITELPIATTSTLGAVKVDGTSILIQDDGTISAVQRPGGTTNYTVLSNKPQINSVELVGNKTLEELGIANAEHTHVVSDVTDLQASLDTKANTSDLSTVATSGSYTDLTNKPTIPTVNNATITIQKNGTSVGTFTTNQSTAKSINITVPTTAADVSALPASTKYGYSFDLSINPDTYIVSLTLKDQDGTTIGTAQTIDLPLESVVVSGSYDKTNKKIVLTLESGSTIDIPVGDLIAGLQTEITTTNKLSADLIADGTTNKVVTVTEKSTWNNKQDTLTAGAGIKIENNIISSEGTKILTDDVTIVQNDNVITTIGTKTKSNTNLYSWVGTQTEYETDSNNGTITSDTQCLITDDEQELIGTVELNVPTKVSDLANDSNFVNKIQLDTKQDKLTAGTGIKIENNTISITTVGTSGWGDITGNIEDQEDLQIALNNKQDNIVSITKAEYDQLEPDPNTYYAISDDTSDVSILEIIYPVGSLYLSTNETCPLSNFFGTWELVISNYNIQDTNVNIFRRNT